MPSKKHKRTNAAQAKAAARVVNNAIQPGLNGKQKSSAETAVGKVLSTIKEAQEKATASSAQPVSSQSIDVKAQQLPEVERAWTDLNWRFYRSIALSYAFEYDKESIEPSALEDPCSSTLSKFRSGICYICDHRPGGSTTTAAALQATPKGVAIWLAANAGVSDRTYRLLRDLLQGLHNPASRSTWEQTALERVVNHGEARLRLYVAITNRELTRCQKVLSSFGAKHGFEYAHAMVWLNHLRYLLAKNSKASLLDMVKFCSKAKPGSPIHDFLQVHAQEAKCDERRILSSLWHAIARLGNHVNALHYIAEGVVAFPMITEILTISRVEAASEGVLPLLVSEEFPRHELDALLADRKSEDLKERKQQLEARFPQIRVQVRRGCNKTRVHAEILMLNHFRKNNFKFFKDDCAIGCSKAPCYLCCCYLRVVRDSGYRLTIPCGSDRVYPAWRCPDVQPKDPGWCLPQRVENMEAMVRSMKEDLPGRIQRYLGELHGNQNPKSQAVICEEIESRLGSDGGTLLSNKTSNMASETVQSRASPAVKDISLDESVQSTLLNSEGLPYSEAMRSPSRNVVTGNRSAPQYDSERTIAPVELAQGEELLTGRTARDVATPSNVVEVASNRDSATLAGSPLVELSQETVSGNGETSEKFVARQSSRQTGHSILQEPLPSPYGIQQYLGKPGIPKFNQMLRTKSIETLEIYAALIQLEISSRDTDV